MSTVVLTQVEPEFRYLFSVCTIVNNLQEYGLMKTSFETCGFSENCEYLIYDNSVTNHVDAYQAIRGFLHQAKGKYLVIVHQDVRCIDQREVLEKCLLEISQKDPLWAICGNAGSSGYHSIIMHITNAGKVIKHENLPARVSSLDENLLIINRTTNLTISADLKGFHLYGTDLCLVADFLGYTSYVIPFMVDHLSVGNLKDLESHVEPFVQAYGRKLRNRFIETTCTKFYLSNTLVKNKMYNLSPGFSVVKAIQRVKKILGVIRGGEQHKKITKSNSFKR